MATFSSERLMESVKEIFYEELKLILPDTKITFNYKNQANDELDLEDPIIWVEINATKNIDRQVGYFDGHGGRTKRKRVKVSINVISMSDADSILKRDRIVQKIESEFGKTETIFRIAKKGLRRMDIRFMNSYRARENVQVARLETFSFVTIRE